MDKDITSTAAPTKGWARVGFALNESFSAALEKHTDNCEYVIKLADEKLFSGRFKDKIPSRNVIKAGTLASTFGAASLLAITVPAQAFGLMAFGAAADVMPDQKSHLARVLRSAVHSCNMAYDTLESGNIGGIATNIMILKNIRQNSIEQKDFPPAINDNGKHVSFTKRLKNHIPDLLQDKSPI